MNNNEVEIKITGNFDEIIEKLKEIIKLLNEIADINVQIEVN